jgi:hypothetical protein
MFLSLLCVSTDISSDGYTKVAYTPGDVLNIKIPSDSIAYFIAEKSIYGKATATTFNANTRTSVDLTGAAVTRSLKILHKDVSLSFSESNILRIWVVPTSVCGGKTMFANIPTNFTFTSTLSGDSSLCVFPTISNTVDPIIVTSTSTVETVDPSSFSKTAVTDKFTYADGMFLLISGAGETKIVLEAKDAVASNECFANVFKVLATDSTISSDPLGITTSLVCPEESITSGTIIGKGFPIVVLVLLIILVIFCIANGVYTFISKRKREM